MAAISRSSDEFVAFDDVDGLSAIIERSSFEQWQVYLHPDQKGLVDRPLRGAARIRGVSGSGKTVVALHRARRIARTTGPGTYVLFTTFNRALAEAASRQLDTICGSERDRIEVVHLHRWCLEYLQHVRGRKPRFDPDGREPARREALGALSDADRKHITGIPDEYLWDEINFLSGRFLDEQAADYLKTDRAGRGRALSESQRQVIFGLYCRYQEQLRARQIVDPSDFVRLAFEYRVQKGMASARTYAAVIVDEVQDLSELALRVLQGLAPISFLMVGDGTQRIFTKGFSLKGLGIDVSGRSIVLRKNYRNTRQILQAAFPLVSARWDEEFAESPATDERSPLFSVREGDRPAIVRCVSPIAEAHFVRREIEYLVNYHGYQPTSICVMARNGFYRELLLKTLRAGGITAVDYRADRDTDQAANPGVRVSSLHSAKGHEYTVVFICGLVDGVMPQRHHDDIEIDDEKAVLYVGLTRARDLVYLSYSESDPGGPQRRSRFLSLIEHACDLLWAPPHLPGV